jgi:hypothetical protein
MNLPDPNADLKTPFTDPGVRRKKLEAVPIGGNAWSDGPLMMALDELIWDDRETWEDRRWAIDYLGNEVMGLGEPPATTADVKAYMES